MSLSQFCTDANWAWDSELGSAFHYMREDGQIRTIFRYQIPYPLGQECLILKKRKVPESERLPFYKNLVRCIQRQVVVSKYLSQANVNSILTYDTFEQERSDDGVASIYLETEQVWPILNHLLVGEVSALTVLDVMSRLAVILRDIYKDPVGLVHRGIDLREVYISAENKILMGGFFYAACSQLGPYPDYLFGGPSNLPSTVRQGGPGSHKTDIQTLSAIAWNLFSGLPYDTEWKLPRNIAPQYAFPELNSALIMGLSGDDEVCNAFRRRLSECRKILNKPGVTQTMVPIRKPQIKEFRVELI